MNIKGVLVAVMILISFGSKEQAAAIVYDPTNAVQIAGVLESVNKLQESAEEWKANAEFLSKVMEQGQEVKRLLAMLEGMICATDELELYAGLSGELTICENKLEFDITLMKIEGVSESLSWITTGGIMLSQYETMESLKDLNDQLEDAIRKVNDMNRFLRGNFMKRIYQEWLNENEGAKMSSLTEMNL